MRFRGSQVGAPVTNSASMVEGLAPAARWPSLSLAFDRRRVLQICQCWLSADLAWFTAILTLSVVFGLLWMFTIPFQQAPDEAAHFQMVRFIRDFGRLPRFSPDELWLLRTQVGAVESYATFP